MTTTEDSSMSLEDWAEELLSTFDTDDFFAGRSSIKETEHQILAKFTSLFTELEGMAEGMSKIKDMSSNTYGFKPIKAIPLSKLQDLKKKYGVE